MDGGDEIFPFPVTDPSADRPYKLEDVMRTLAAGAILSTETRGVEGLKMQLHDLEDRIARIEQFLGCGRK